MSIEKSVRAAVIGKSASGKSEFIRSFSYNPELISSVGKGQTTRSYAEYDFLVTDERRPSTASIALMNEKEFVNRRIEQVNHKLLSLDEIETISISWLLKQIDEYNEDIEDAFIYACDFFDIKEFDFLSGTIVEEICSWYKVMCDLILSVQKGKSFVSLAFMSEDGIRQIETFIKRYVNSPAHELSENGTIDEQKKAKKYSEEDVLESIYELFYSNCYRIIMNSIDVFFSKKFGQEINSKNTSFLLEITQENKDELELFLKVCENSTNDLLQKRSLSSMVSKIKISTVINPKYFQKIKNLGLSNILLVDTYGLDHEQGLNASNLEERYNQIFSCDYPEVTVVLFVEPIRPGAHNDFSEEIKILYTVKPNIMTYIIGSFIDKQDHNLLKNKKGWLVSEEKSSDYPKFEGRVMDIIYQQSTIANGLRRSRVPASLANKRLDIMRKRFGLFCGNLDLTSDSINEIGQIMQDMNIASISSIITSICDQEHLGSSYININKLLMYLSEVELIIPFAKQFIIMATERFQKIYTEAGPRTKWRIRKNLEAGVLGFHGSVTDATWFRVFNDTYNGTFTKQIKINEQEVMLSDVYSIQGNEKLAFDELMAYFFPYIFNRKCLNEKDILPHWPHEVDCKKCPSCLTRNGCMWGIILNCFSEDDFIFDLKGRYTRVIDWLIASHKIDMKCDENFYTIWSEIFLDRMSNQFIPLCRMHNLKIASKKAKRSDEAYLKIKDELYQEYSEGYDSKIEKQDFFNQVNKL